MEEIVKHINDTNASWRALNAGDAKNTDLFLDNEHYELFRNAGEQITVRFNKENLQKSILFIASILPRKYDNSATHKTIRFSSSFVFDQLAFLDAFFTLDGVKVETRTQVWNARKDVPKKNGEIDNRFYFNGLLEEVPYKGINGEQKTGKFTIRNYVAGGFSDLHIKIAIDGIFDIWVTNTQEAYDDGKDKVHEEDVDNNSLILQQIFYGAPGTGKSFEINRLTKNKEVIRTTFHPDSDYSTFVGAYKPTSIEVPVRDVTGKVIVENGKQVTENRIVYEFVEQAFLQAYTKAWLSYANKADGEKAEEQYLVIEEINRGNCAQIFGDLFQLLDRNGFGFSDYPITADKDMKKQLAKAFKGIVLSDAERINSIYGKDIVSQVLNGDILLLPDNLFIWATMNTSDQSLFPIDSAFKRRWDWKYIPICEGKENGISLGWKIKANGNLYDWWQFVKKINAEINEQTKSEDKKLGYFFCKAQDGIVSAETFVSKVVFYLWNDVFKDQAFASDIFKDGEDELTFNSFFEVNANGKAVIKEEKVEILLKNLKMDPMPMTDELTEAEKERDENTPMTVVLDGEEINEGTSSNTFIKTLQKIGLDKLVDKNYNDVVIVKREISESLKYMKQVGEFYIYTGLWTQYKKRWLQVMAKDMDINLTVE